MTSTFKRLAMAGAAIFGLTAGAASAATLNFDLTARNANLQNALTYDSGDMTLTVTGRTDAGTTRQVAAWRGAGVGIQAWDDSRHTIDSEGKDDIAVLSFSRAVSITELRFSNIRQGSTFDLLVDAGTGLAKELTSAVGSTVAVSGTNGTESAQWGVEAGDSYMERVCVIPKLNFLCGNVERFSEFKLAGVTVEWDDMPPPAAVPVPAAGVLLLGALGALGALRRKG